MSGLQDEKTQKDILNSAIAEVERKSMSFRRSLLDLIKYQTRTGESKSHLDGHLVMAARL